MIVFCIMPPNLPHHFDFYHYRRLFVGMKENLYPATNVPFDKRIRSNVKERFFEPKTNITLATLLNLKNLENCSGQRVAQLAQIVRGNWFLSVTERLGSGNWFLTIIRMLFRL